MGQRKATPGEDRTTAVPTPAELDAILAATPFLQPYDFRVEAAAPGECTLVVPFLRSLERPGGIVSGMTLMGAADVAMWLAIMTLRGTVEHWVTTDMKTAFLRSAREEDLSCTARILKAGRRTMYGTAESHGAQARLVAHHVLAYTKVDT
jgi:acyl-coenzyme A thioesterase PaaI-like protein